MTCSSLFFFWEGSIPFFLKPTWWICVLPPFGECSFRGKRAPRKPGAEGAPPRLTGRTLAVGCQPPATNPNPTRTSQPANQPTSQPANQPANQPASQPTSQPASQPQQAAAAATATAALVDIGQPLMISLSTSGIPTKICSHPGVRSATNPSTRRPHQAPAPAEDEAPPARFQGHSNPNGNRPCLHVLLPEGLPEHGPIRASGLGCQIGTSPENLVHCSRSQLFSFKWSIWGLF